MVTLKKFLKLLQTRDEKEIESIIGKMTESDAKGLLKTIIFQMNNERYKQNRAMGLVIDEVRV